MFSLPALECPAELANAPKDVCPPGAKRELEGGLDLSKRFGQHAAARRQSVPLQSVASDAGHHPHPNPLPSRERGFAYPPSSLAGENVASPP